MSKELSVNKDPAFDSISNIAINYVHQARNNVLKSVNHEQVIAYWNIGRLIVENEQAGQDRADYGTQLIQKLSKDLSREFKRGFSISNLQYMAWD